MASHEEKFTTEELESTADFNATIRDEINSKTREFWNSYLLKILDEFNQTPRIRVDRYGCSATIFGSYDFNGHEGKLHAIVQDVSDPLSGFTASILLPVAPIEDAFVLHEYEGMIAIAKPKACMSPEQAIVSPASLTMIDDGYFDMADALIDRRSAIVAYAAEEVVPNMVFFREDIG